MNTSLNDALPTLRTPRLVLNALQISDAPRVRLLAGDAAIADTTLYIPHPYPEGAAEAWMSTHLAQWLAGEAMQLAVRLAETGELIGAIGLVDIVAGHRAEMGYWIGKPYWGRGHCTEAAAAVIDYAFGPLGLARVYAHHFSRNPASGAVMRKVGMVHEGCLRRHVLKDGRLEDIEFYGILNGRLDAAKD